jgi:hypothetical protein
VSAKTRIGTRGAGNRDEVEGVAGSTLNVFRGGAVGSIDWLDLLDSFAIHVDRE